MPGYSKGNDQTDRLLTRNLVRWGRFAVMMAGLLYFVGYAGMAKLLLPTMSNLGGHVVLGLAGLATLLALVGVLAKDAAGNHVR